GEDTLSSAVLAYCTKKNIPITVSIAFSTSKAIKSLFFIKSTPDQARFIVATTPAYKPLQFFGTRLVHLVLGHSHIFLPSKQWATTYCNIFCPLLQQLSSCQTQVLRPYNTCVVFSQQL